MNTAGCILLAGLVGASGWSVASALQDETSTERRPQAAAHVRAWRLFLTLAGLGGTGPARWPA